MKFDRSGWGAGYRLIGAQWLIRGIFGLLIIYLLAGCVAGKKSYKQGLQALENKDYDEAVGLLMDAYSEDGQAQKYRLSLRQAQDLAARQHLENGEKLLGNQHYRDALTQFRMASNLDGSLFAAVEGAEWAQKYLTAEQLCQAAELAVQNHHLDEAHAAVEHALNLIPGYQPAVALRSRIKTSRSAFIDGVELAINSPEPINLNFRDTRLPDVFKILTKLSGINFILDEEIRNGKTTLFLEQASFAQALELLLRMNKLDKKILNSKTIILFPKTREKQKQFEDQIIQTFFLSHIEAEEAVNLLRTMLQVRKVYVQKDLNAVVIRDEPEVIRLAQKMLAATDRGNAEVVFDLELLEVNHTDTQELGLKLSSYAVGAGVSVPGTETILDSGVTAGGSTVNLLTDGLSVDPFYSVPTASFRLLKTLVDAEVLANPKIRVRNKTKANVHVGSREPVVTVTINDTQVSENVQYIDVGVKLDVEPTIQLDKTVVTKLGLEVSNVSGRETTSNGTAVITISSTNAQTTLTLKDGEQTIIGGLIRDDKSVTKNKIPLLGDLPLVGELFNGTDKSKIKREILLSITPHIVKNVSVPNGEFLSIWSGGEEDLKDGRAFGSFADEYSRGQDLRDEPGVNAPVSDSDQQGSEKAQSHVNRQVANETPGEVSVVQGATPIAASSVTADQSTGSQPTGIPMLQMSGPKQAKLGEELVYKVNVQNVADLYSAPIQISYDPEKLSFEKAEEGDFLQQGETATFFTQTHLADSGRIALGLKRGQGATGAAGSGTLADLHFKTVAAGTVQLDIVRQGLRDSQGKSLDIETTGITTETSAAE